MTQIIITALACAVLAGALLPWARRFVESSSRWLTVPIAASTGGALGAASALVADDWAGAVALGAVAAAAGVLIPVDQAVKRLPNLIVGALTIAVLVSVVAGAAFTGGWWRLLASVVTAIVVTVVFFVLAMISPAGIGLGDVKLSFPLALALAWSSPMVAVLGACGAFVTFGIWSLVLIATGRAKLSGDLPFGPWMFIGAIAAFAYSTWGPAWA